MLEYSKLKLFLLFTVMLVGILISTNHYRATPIKEQVPEIAEKIIKPINSEHLRCLATNIYYEAGSESYMGQVAVARVVMNRVLHGFGSNPCKVVYQTTTVTDPEEPTIVKKVCQFSWVCDGRNIPNKLNARYKQAEDIAKQVLAENKWAEIMPNNVLFFHNTGVNPNWPYKKITTIGNHIFYSKGREKVLDH